jgi:glutamate formiminotransferase
VASEQEIAEIEAEIDGELQAIAFDVDRMKVEAATAATAQIGAELIDLRKQVADARKDGAVIAIAAVKRRLGIF